MSRFGVFAATLIAGLVCIGSAFAQGVPPRLQGDYAIGSCAAPDVDVTIDAAGMHVYDPQSGDVLADVQALSVQDGGSQVTMDVVLDGHEDGTLILVALDGGAVEVRYQPDGGAEEAPQRLELCAAADVQQPPAATMASIPDALLGEWVTGSCAAPQDRLVIEPVTLTAYDQGSPNPTAVVDVIGVEQVPGGYLVSADFQGQQVNVELNVIGEDQLELVFIGPDGRRDTPETLQRCGAPQVDMPPATSAELPEAYLGRYVIGEDASCATATTAVIFAPTELTILDNGDEIVVIDVTGVVATEPDLVFNVVAGDDVGSVTMRRTGPDTFEVVFAEEGGETEAPETFTYCDGTAGPTVDGPAAAEIPAAYLGEYAVGDAVSCNDPTAPRLAVEATRLVATFDGDQQVADVLEVLAAEPDLVLSVDAEGQLGEMRFHAIGDGLYEVTFTEAGDDTPERPETVAYCDGAATPVDEPTAAELPDEYLGRYAFDGGTCDDAANGNYLLFEATQLVVFDGGEQVMVIPVTGVTATEPDLVFDVSVPGEGAGEIAMRPTSGGSYDVTLTEAGSTSADRDTFIFCDGAPVEEPDGPEMVGATVPDAYLGTYVFGDDPAMCGTADAGEHMVFEPARLVMMDGPDQEMVIVVEGVVATEPNLVLAIFEERLGEAELALIPAGGNVYNVTVTEPDGSVEDETLVFCDAATEGPADGPETPVATELPAAYLGRYVFDDDGMGCESTDSEVIFEPTSLNVYENGELELTIDVTGVTATEPDLVFTAVIPGQGDVEITLHAIGGDQYDVALRESGSDDVENETFTYCPPAGEVPPVDGPTGTDTGGLTPFLFDQSVTDFAAFMDDLEGACAPGSEQQCLDVFFGFADVTGDGLLTQAELARLTRHGAKWAVSNAMMLMSDDGSMTDGLDEGQKLAIHLATMVTGPLIADGLIYNFDYDGNDALSQVELFPGGVENAPLAVDALMATFTEDTLEQVGDALDTLDDLM